MLLLVYVVLLAQPRTHTVLKRFNAKDRRWNRYAFFIGLSVASVKRQPSSLKKFVALVPIRPNDSKARGTKWCIVESSSYFVSFLVTVSSAAAAAFIGVDAKYESLSVSATVTSHTAALPACQGTLVRPSGRLPSEQSNPTGSLVAGSPAVKEHYYYCSCNY